jgi:hypothetical protein
LRLSGCLHPYFDSADPVTDASLLTIRVRAVARIHSQVHPTAVQRSLKALHPASPCCLVCIIGWCWRLLQFVLLGRMSLSMLPRMGCWCCCCWYAFGSYQQPKPPCLLHCALYCCGMSIRASW